MKRMFALGLVGAMVFTLGCEQVDVQKEKQAKDIPAGSVDQRDFENDQARSKSEAKKNEQLAAEALAQGKAVLESLFTNGYYALSNLITGAKFPLWSIGFEELPAYFDDKTTIDPELNCAQLVFSHAAGSGFIDIGRRSCPNAQGMVIASEDLALTLTYRTDNKLDHYILFANGNPVGRVSKGYYWGFSVPEKITHLCNEQYESACTILVDGEGMIYDIELK